MNPPDTMKQSRLTQCIYSTYIAQAIYIFLTYILTQTGSLNVNLATAMAAHLLMHNVAEALG